MKQKTIFVVDDDPVTQLYVSHALNSTGKYSIETYTNAKACLINIEHRPNLIVVNSVFYSSSFKRENTGLDLVRSIATKYPDLPMIVLSANEGRQDIYNFISEGARNYIVKKGDYMPELLCAIEEELEIEKLYQSIKVG